nr:hypothetical protein FFPRI1PSEUD_44850 [Pseudomonas sp. FFPRI_1]
MLAEGRPLSDREWLGFSWQQGSGGLEVRQQGGGAWFPRARDQAMCLQAFMQQRHPGLPDGATVTKPTASKQPAQ